MNPLIHGRTGIPKRNLIDLAMVKQETKKKTTN